MVELTRTVRFSLPLAGAGVALREAPRSNTFAGWPSMATFGVYSELTVTCRGEPDPRTGYLLNIADIDAAVRTRGLPVLAAAVDGGRSETPGALLRDIAGVVIPALDCEVRSVRWHLTPYYSLTVETKSMDRVLIRQQFTFSAAHRLHCPDLDDEENRRIFGKCNNPSGHGHNYRLEVAVDAAAPSAEAGGADDAIGLLEIERLVVEIVIERFDHTHLNLDTQEFANLNPSVENIARVCHGLLHGPLAEAGATLRAVTVWETERTSCTYPASN